jgi:hypothetical protein
MHPYLKLPAANCRVELWRNPSLGVPGIDGFHCVLYSTLAQIAAFVPLSLRERPALSSVEGAGVRVFKKAQIVNVRSIPMIT